jgi:hypothetical protein
MTKFTIDTLKTWVLETVDPIPVWSGAARASFLFLAAKAMTSLTINPIAPDPPGSRITLGITEAKAEVIADMNKGEYGWNWSSTLAHIGIVEDRVGFVSAGLQAIKGKQPTLPQPTFTTKAIARTGRFLRGE